MRPLRLFCLLMLASLVLTGCTLLTPSSSDGSTIPTPPPVTNPDAEPPAEPPAPVWQPSADQTALEHIASGFLCPREQDGFLLTGEETFAGLGEGKDVACLFRAAEGGEVKLHFTDFGRDVSASAHLKGVQTSITDTNTILGNLPPPPLGTGTNTEAAAYHIRATSALRPDIPVHTAVWITRIGPWHVKARATYEADRSAQTGQFVSHLLTTARDTISAPSPTPAPTPPPQR